MPPLQINLALAWLWMVFGFLSGLVMGLNFHRENWLGGYGSFKRRLYRLAHISFFGLAAANLMFYFTARLFLPLTPVLQIASWAFAIGAVFMPICCVLTAHITSCRSLFAVPVTSLVLAGALTLWEVIKL
jgi:hypothetical protein